MSSHRTCAGSALLSCHSTQARTARSFLLLSSISSVGISQDGGGEGACALLTPGGGSCEPGEYGGVQAAYVSCGAMRFATFLAAMSLARKYLPRVVSRFVRSLQWNPDQRPTFAQVQRGASGIPRELPISDLPGKLYNLRSGRWSTSRWPGSRHSYAEGEFTTGTRGSARRQRKLRVTLRVGVRARGKSTSIFT